MRLSDLGEFGLIDLIRARFPQPGSPELGIGDDAALLTPAAGQQLVVSTDLLAEGIHFDRTFGTAHLLGRKSLAVNLSDLAAMGATPRWALLSLAIPANFPFDELGAFLDGFADQAASHSVLLVGGDTCGSRSGLVISVTIMGEQYPELILKRAGALPGDDIWVSGTVGDSALGLQLLQGNATEYASDALRYVVNRHLDPAPRCRLGQCLATARLVTSMVDISDGLLADLGHICRQSGCGADINLASAPLSQSFREATASEAYFPWRLAVCGGEDYELCFTAPSCNRAAIQEISKTAGVQVAVIGKVTDSGRVVARLPDGSDFQPSASGYTHF